MIGLLQELLSKQDPTQPHTLLTRLVVSFCIGLAYIVLHGFYGLIAAIIVYLLGVELMGLPLQWIFYPFILGLLSGCWQSFLRIRDYWKNYGYAG
jgi:uncharacterized membrane protein YczE